jgi:hypothetical protein
MPFSIIAVPVLVCLVLGIVSGLRAQRNLRP